MSEDKEDKSSPSALEEGLSDKQLWYKANREKVRECQKKYYAANAERLRHKAREHYQNNREAMLAYRVEWRKNNPEKEREYWRNRSLKKRALALARQIESQKIMAEYKKEKALAGLRECSRMRLKATLLPCGKRLECFMPRCPKLPARAKAPAEPKSRCF
ncbi:MAG: hypothetical protein LBS77_07420 [Desulfovibrio sp.]|jgi:hypothetical protein|nr:hypothetical protein [Desulfovibrio sp.]